MKRRAIAALGVWLLLFGVFAEAARAAADPRDASARITKTADAVEHALAAAPFGRSAPLLGSSFREAVGAARVSWEREERPARSLGREPARSVFASFRLLRFAPRGGEAPSEPH